MCERERWICVCDGVFEREREVGSVCKMVIDNTLLHKAKDLSASRFFFADLSLMTNTAILNTPNKNTVNYAG